MKNKKLLVSALLGVSTLAIGAVVGIAAGKKSGFRAYADPVEPEWHHYHAQNPSLNWQNKATNKGTKEYWVQCGGGYQYTVPDSDNKVYETGAPDTSEFAADDDRWVTYCDLNGHNYDAKGVCEYCNELQYGSKLIDKAIANTTISDEEAPLGFTSVYTRNGMSSGPCGYSHDVSGCDVLYFSLYSTASSTIAFGGNNGVNPVLWANDWYNILLTKDENGWVANYKKASEVNWNTDHTKVDENKATDFATILRLYNWEGLESVTIYSTEVYAGTELPPEIKTSPLNIGVWNGTYHFTNTSSIDDLVDAGFNRTIGINPIWNSNWNSILDYSKNKGVKHIVDPRGWDYDNSKYAEWDGTAPSYANHEAVEGFFMYDEPSTKLYSSLAQMQSTFKSVMPSDKLCFINMLSGAASMTMLYGTESAQSNYNYYETNYVNGYENTVHPDVYSFDSYPLFTNGQIRKSYFCSLDIWSNLSKTTHTPVWYTLLSSAHASGDGEGYAYVLPSQSQLEWQMSVALSFGITDLVHYVFASGESGYSTMANSDGSKNAYYNDVKAANRNMHALDQDLTRFEWEGATTYHNNSKVNLLFKDLKHTVTNSSVGFNSISAASDLLIGSYIDENSNRAYMVTNSGISTDYSSTWDNKYTNFNKNVAYSNDNNSVTLTLNENIVGAYVIQNGSKTYVPANNDSLSLYLTSFGSAFVIPVK